MCGTTTIFVMNEVLKWIQFIVNTFHLKGKDINLGWPKKETKTFNLQSRNYLLHGRRTYISSAYLFGFSKFSDISCMLSIFAALPLHT